jgi:hypothetical protein
MLLVTLLALGLPVAARAQEPTTDRVQLAIDLTDRRIEQAQALAAGSDDERAEAEIAVAVDLQSRAVSAFAAAQLRVALTLTLDARRHADRAIALIKNLPDPDRVAVQLERTRELIDRARDRIEECNSGRARALLRVATEMQARAESAARDGRYLAALQLTLSARERALRSLRLCNLEDNAHDAAERALRRTREVIDRAREIVAESGDEAARGLLRRAIELQEQAEAQFRLEHFEACLRQTQAARALAQRAARLSQDGP